MKKCQQTVNISAHMTSCNISFISLLSMITKSLKRLVPSVTINSPTFCPHCECKCWYGSKNKQCLYHDDEQKTNKCITHSMYWCLIYCYMFRYFKMSLSGSPIWTCWDGAQCRVGTDIIASNTGILIYQAAVVCLLIITLIFVFGFLTIFVITYCLSKINIPNKIVLWY
jgi:hypothetical protein